MDPVSTKRPATAESAASSGADSVAAVATLEKQTDPSPSADSATEGAALFEQVNPEAVSAARRSLKDIVFQEYKTGKFASKKDPTCLSTIACPSDINKESAKFTRGMKVLCLGFSNTDWSVMSNKKYSDQESQDNAERVIREAAQKALEVMLRLEKDAGIGEDRKKPGSQATATALGLGERYRRWEREVKESRKDPEDLYEAKLVECGFKSKVTQPTIGDYFQAFTKGRQNKK